MARESHTSTTPKLTPKQKEVLEFISSFATKQGYAPSQQEIAKHFGFSSLGTVQNYLVRLERQGVLKKEWNGKRAMEVVPKQASQSGAVVNLPWVGRVAAGSPIEAIESRDSIEVPASMLGKAQSAPGDAFALRVTGDSMIEDGILDGDFVIIRKARTITNGQTVVALVNNEATIKRYYRKGSVVELHPANSKYQPIVIDLAEGDRGENFKIEGVLTGVIRRLE